METHEFILQILKEYPNLVRKIELLQFELHHPLISFAEKRVFALGNMPDEHPEVPLNTVFHITNTLASENISDRSQEYLMDIAERLFSLESQRKRLEHYVALLDPRSASVIRLRYFQEATWEQVASEMNISVRSAQKLKFMAVKELAKMYEFVAQV